MSTLAPTARRGALALLIAGASVSCNAKSSCAPPPESAPDYGSHASWACRPNVEGDACDGDLSAIEVLSDGSTRAVPFVPTPAPEVDCFYVYPTVDDRLRAGLHTDLSDREHAFRTVAIQAARFGEVCRVFAPLYRQVTLGTYAARREVQGACFDVAYHDVLAAFEHYLAHDNLGRGFVLIGHSQGAQIVSRLLRERVERDPALRAQLVVALPLGWALGTDEGGLTGGSFAATKVCTSAEENGCVAGYRSWPAGRAVSAGALPFAEGKRTVCVHPGDVAHGGPAALSRSFFPRGAANLTLPDAARAAPFVLYRDFFEAECVTAGSNAVLAVRPRGANDRRANPIDFAGRVAQSELGLHVFDVQLALGDLIDLVGRKIAARRAAR